MSAQTNESTPVPTPRKPVVNRGQRAGENLKSVLIGVHCTPKLVAQLERFISGLEYDEMTRPEAIRLILKRYFKDNGIE
ncbi:MAG: hypothetical protein RIR62_2587 [Pseudomonadota bacterium]|jgi:hypothetical protein